jgi:putative endonuclease
MIEGNYFVYITTNPARTVLYTGVTNDLLTRICQHFENKGKRKTFAGRYYCYNLIYYELHEDVNQAIEREKDIKNMSRKRKEELISSLNPEWKFFDTRYLY